MMITLLQGHVRVVTLPDALNLITPFYLVCFPFIWCIVFLGSLVLHHKMCMQLPSICKTTKPLNCLQLDTGVAIHNLDLYPTLSHRASFHYVKKNSRHPLLVT